MQQISLIILSSLLIILQLLLPPYAAAQDSFKGNTGEAFTPSTIIIIIMGIIFMFTGCLAVFLRRFSDGCFGLNVVPAAPGLTADGGLATHGLHPDAIKSLPTFFYSDVKQHRTGRVELECAVCLTEFLDSDALRLLPGCRHVFHPRCIDRWLATHVTCPICRRSLEPDQSIDDEKSRINNNTVINIHDDDDDDHRSDGGEDRDDDNHVVEDCCEGNLKKKIEGKFPRSHSTGHSMAGSDRFTLVLPEEVQNSLPNRSKTLTSILSPMSAKRCGWFSVTPPMIGSRSGSVRCGAVSNGLVGNSSKNLELGKVKTADRLWPI